MVGVEEVAEAEEEEAEAEMTMTTTTWMARHRIKRVLLDVVDDDDVPTNSSTMPSWSNSWCKSCKISKRGSQDVALRGSRPPTRSPQLTKTDNDPP